MHIAERIEVYHERNGGDHDQHHHGNGIEQDAQVEMKRTEWQPRDVVGHNRRECAIGEAFSREILVGREIGKNGNDGQRGCANQSRHLVTPHSSRLRDVHIDHTDKEEREEGQ